MKLLILNGPNLNLLEMRDKNYYGSLSLRGIEETCRSHFPNIDLDFRQSNSEQEMIEQIHSASAKYNGLIINPGGLGHTSIALRDALELCSIPKIEVHLSNISARDTFRKISLTSSVCDGYISGLKHYSYMLAINYLVNLI